MFSALQGGSVLFGPFCLKPGQQLLLEADQAVPLGARALSLLVVLVGRAGEVVGKEELMALVWPRTVVEESNLRVHVAGLRRALRDGQNGNRFIVNIPGRGYSFVSPVQFVADEPAASVSAAAVAERVAAAQLPNAATRLFGRDMVVMLLHEQLPQRRFVTLVGPGGIGKTAVAIAVARTLAASYRDGVTFVDFSAIRDPALVPSTIVASLGLTLTSQDVMPALLAYLARRSTLLVLDNCEHVIEVAANTAEQVSASAADVHILCTSREPLRAAGERVHRLQPLEAPAASAGLSAAEALTYPGIQLFVDRAAAGLHGYALTDADAPVVAEICQRLDGIALAIEFAAGRVAAFGVREVAKRLDDRFRLLTSGRRTALARHQTLSATLDWSFDLLPTLEQALLCRLSIFAGEFSLDAAVAVAGHGDPMFAVDHVADLVAKSLVVAETRGSSVRYRLLDTTRLYGFEKLRASGELPDTARRHAAYLRGLFGRAEADSVGLPAEQWMEIYATQLDNVRAALDWAGSGDGDADLLTGLTVGAVPLWVHLSLMSECRVRVRAALAVTAADDLELRMRLTAALGWSLMYAAGRSGEILTSWSETLALATRLGNDGYRLHALWGIWISKLNNGELDAALALAHEMLDLTAASASDADRMMADRLMGTILHYRGDQNGARDYLERMFRRYASAGPQPRIARFHVDQQVPARYFLARVLWLQGHVDQAVQAVERNIVEGRSLGQALSFSSTLGQAACKIALFTGDLAAARRHARALIEHAEKHSFQLWLVWARCFDGLITIKEGDAQSGLREMGAAFDLAGDARLLPRYMVLLGEFAMAQGQEGDARGALATLEGMLERCDRSAERWYVPELLRFKGEVTAIGGTAKARADAAAALEASMRLSMAQGARSWTLRAATSLARLQAGTRRAAEATARLAAVYEDFREGFATQDLLEARRLLSDETAPD